MVLTRPDMAVYVQALQRHAAAPRIIDCKRLNTVVRCIQRQRIGIWYRRIPGELKLVVFSDAAFKTQPEESSGLALRGCTIWLTSTTGGGLTAADGGGQLLEWICRRQRRVVRSTFSAALNGVIDSLESAILVQIGLHQIYHGTEIAATDLADLMEKGGLRPKLDLVTLT